MGSRIAVVVLGMHRSGTSAVARCISLLGYALPRDLMPPKQDNPKGFWEPVGVVRLNDRILAEYGTAWDRPDRFGLEGKGLPESHLAVLEAIAGRYQDEAVAALEASYAGAERIVLKDPRISLLLPLWRRALARLGYAPRYVLAHRHPLACAASLRERNDMAPHRAHQLWLRYTLDALSLVERERLAIVDYDRLVAEPQDVLADLHHRLGESQPLRAAAAEELQRFLDAGARHFKADADALAREPGVPQMVKDLQELLGRWDATPGEKRQAQVQELGRAFDQFCLLSGLVLAVRTVILHYHLFKNAGTSVDEILKQNFPGRWSTREFERAGRQEELAGWLKAEAACVAFSSHTASLPAPRIPGVQVVPVLFVRHPIDRIGSAYAFERKQEASTRGARLAKAHDLAGYVRARLAAKGDRQCRNFHAVRLAAAVPGPAAAEEARALQALRRLPFVGLVEDFDASMQRLKDMLAPYFPDFQVRSARKNVSGERASNVEQRVAAIRAEIGEPLYEELVEANAVDLKIYAAVKHTLLRTSAGADVKREIQNA